MRGIYHVKMSVKQGFAHIEHARTYVFALGAIAWRQGVDFAVGQ